MKKVLLFMFLMIMFALKAEAATCDAENIKRLKELAKGVEITYETVEPYNNDGMMIYDDYIIKINGLSDELYVYDSTNDERVPLNKNSDGIIEYRSISNGKIKFKIFNKYCSNKLNEISIVLPIYNYYRDRDECKEIDYKIKYCDRYVEEKITDEEFYYAYNNYKESNKKEETRISNVLYYLFGGIVISLSVGLVIFILKKRRGTLE